MNPRRTSAAFAYQIIPAKDDRPAIYIGGPAGHSIPVGWKFAPTDDDPPKYVRDDDHR